VNEFVEECRREWRRLGVPDPIANEMAADLTADIEAAEADGGSAEDVLGNSFFDPRRFAAAWASARGVTAPPAAVEPFAPLEPDRPTWLRPLMVIGAAFVGFFVLLAASALVVGRHGVAVASSVARILPPGPTRVRGSFGPFHFVGTRFFMFQNGTPLLALALVALLGIVIALGLVLLAQISWPRRDPKRRFW
jgi:hypothetical protein